MQPPPYTHKEICNISLPKIDLPFTGESLIGYLLRLDYINGLDPGTILRVALPPRQSVNLRNLEIIEKNLNITLLSEILDVDSTTIRSLMLSTIRRKLYRYNSSISKYALKYNRLKICPICIQDWKIPLLFFFQDIQTCLIHGVSLIGQCICGKRIDLFNKGNTLCCPNKSCAMPYTKLDRKFVTSTYEKQSYTQFIYNSFLFNNFLLASHNEKLVKGLYKRICFLDKIHNLAINYIKSAFTLNIYKDPESINFRFGLSDYLRFDVIASLIYKLHIPPLEFSKIDVPEKFDFKVHLSEIGLMKVENEFRPLMGNSVFDTAESLSTTSNYIKYTETLNLSIIKHYYKNTQSYITGKANISNNKHYFSMDFWIKKYSADTNINLLFT